MKKADTRARAAELIHAVMAEQASLSDRLPRARQGLSARDGALLQALVFGTLRQGPRLEWILGRLLDKPLRKRDRIINAVMLLGLHQLVATRVPTHAALSETVEAARALGRPRAAGLVNAVLRRFQREKEALWEAAEAVPTARWQHPEWLIRQCQSDWPGDWEGILAAGNAPPPMILRVNQQQGGRDAFLARLAEADIEARPGPHAPDAVWLSQPCSVDQLPGFAEGLFSVQDESAQQVAGLMQLAPGQRVLDACAAPGGKTAHMLESCPDIAHMLALDVDPDRLGRVRENLDRLGLSADIRAGDVAHPESWWDGESFDRILLDVPCSGTGVIRRHPDIKYLRRSNDAAGLAEKQAAILAGAWSMLAPGGRLLYTTCSIFRQENEGVLERFLAAQPDALPQSLTLPAAVPAGPGIQYLPRIDGGDGFYYGALEKTGKPKRA
ncbi:16S rRNA (cytosine967-C5)-methyltransferase [Natronospira proteinivora]|uniref:16S rRNA (cytosine(967)-C(5))-methyltransferase n=1 Tax=Natronospira proteinivora TaxID=1807133 RepID=A0ABT1G9T5_9GAMM|nr:16S rRNA (cytosine(967)-C(5))-methyltransferase RsmB [Natronospira proteinivora]MCP1728072.1 16S rRNA (cytosine967-C5)-methyltransferase [Natronospira proteinivora]